MKISKLILCILIILIINIKATSQINNSQWLITNFNANNASTISFLDANTGFIAYSPTTSQCKIFRTVNAGNTWNPIWTSSYGNVVLRIHASDVNHIVIYCINSISGSGTSNVQYTTDGGLNWWNASFDSPPNNSFSTPASTMEFFDANTGYLSFTSQFASIPFLYIYKTSNGGKIGICVFRNHIMKVLDYMKLTILQI